MVEPKIHFYLINLSSGFIGDSSIDIFKNYSFE